MPLLLGCVADDFTGATDLASMLVKGGMTTVQVIGVPDGPLAGRRCGGGGAEVAHRGAGERRGGEPRRLRGAAGRRRPADLLEVLLHLRQHGGRQHRAGRRRAGAAARLRLRPRQPGFPDQWAHRLPGPSVRRLGAPERERDGEPSPHPDARRQPGARARAADGRGGGAGALRHRGGGRRRDPPRHDGAEGERAALRGRRRHHRRAPDGDRRGGGGPCAHHRRLGRGDGPARELPPRRLASRARRLRRRPAADGGARGGARRLLLARDARADRAGAGPRADPGAGRARHAGRGGADRGRRSIGRRTSSAKRRS